MLDRVVTKKPPGRWRRLWRRLRGGRISAGRAAASVALGLFVGSQPLYGLHFFLCLALCILFRLDFVLAYLAANISNPVVAPALLALQLDLGFLLLHGEHFPLEAAAAREAGLWGFAGPLALGAVLVGAGLAVVGGALTWALSGRRTVTVDPIDAAMRKTTARFSSAPIGDRIYVAIKLRTDSVAYALGELEGDFGRVLDAGCGRGQLALFLQDLGKTREVFGFDWDHRKVDLARHAAGSPDTFVVADLRDPPWRSADTILLVDVLHYLTHTEQLEVVRRAVEHLRPGGRLLIREVDSSRRLASKVTRWAERVGRRLGYNRGTERLDFCDLDRVEAELAALGLESRRVPSADLQLLSNVLIEGRKPAPRDSV